MLKGVNKVMISNLVDFSWVSSLNQKDRKEILELMQIVIKSQGAIGFPAPLPTEEGERLMSQLNQDIKKYVKHLLVIRNEKKIIVGQAILTQNCLPNCAHRAEVSRAMIHPSYRGLGLVKKGLQAVIKKCEELKIESIELDVRARTSLSRLWEQIGFQIIGENPDYVRINQKVIAGFYMRQSINELKRNLRLP